MSGKVFNNINDLSISSIKIQPKLIKEKLPLSTKMIKEYIEGKYGFQVYTTYSVKVERALILQLYGVDELKKTGNH